MRTKYAVVCVWLAAACAADEPQSVYDPCSALTLALEPDLDTGEVQSVADAVSAWSRVLPTRIELVMGAEQAPDVLPIRFVSGQPFYRAIYWDGLGTIEISRERLAREDYAIALEHELGHAFGLQHVAIDDRPSVMNIGNLVVEPTAADAAGVSARWDACQAPGAAAE